MTDDKKKIAVIAGAGPAGLTSAYEFLHQNTDIHPIVFEQSDEIGGISKTVRYNGNRIDIGGHRFFSKKSAGYGLVESNNAFTRCPCIR